MKDTMGNVIQIRFPNTLWNSGLKSQDPTPFVMQIWHTSRWTADIVPYISQQIISRPYHFITKDPVTALYVGRGFYMAIFFTLLAWTFSLYAKTAFKISTYSYHFLFILFISGILPLVNIDIFPSIRVTTFDVNFLSNYLWPMALMLIALYPYWKAFFNNTWDDNSTLLSQSL